MNTNIIPVNQIFKGKCSLKTVATVVSTIPKTNISCSDVFVKNIKKPSKPRFSFKNLRFKKISKIYSQIFRQDISVEESEKMLQQYKDLLKIKNRDLFFKRAFKQVKKDYGYGNKDIKLIFVNQGKGAMHWDACYGNVNVNSKAIDVFYNSKTLNKNQQIDILSSFVHEFQHAKQTEYAFRANPKKYLNFVFSDKDALDCTIEWLEKPDTKAQIKNIVTKSKKFRFKTEAETEQFLSDAIKKLKTGTYKTDKSVTKLLEMLKNDQRCGIKSIFGNFELFEPNSENYKLGIKYFENCESYTKPDLGTIKNYMDQLIEKEAYKAEKDFSDILVNTLPPTEQLKARLNNFKDKLNRKFSDFILKQLSKRQSSIDKSIN